MSPAVVHDQRSPLLMPYIMGHGLTKSVSALALPFKFGASPGAKTTFYPDERLPSTESLATRADLEATPSEGGESTSDSWAEEPPPPAACVAPPPACVAPTSAPAVAHDAETDAHGAIEALLSLQQIHRTSRPAHSDSLLHQRGPGHPASRAPSPALLGLALHGGIMKTDPSIKFYCRFPGCKKGYASTDAVRKHCRQRHLEWLRRLGHGCPALYCRWEE